MTSGARPATGGDPTASAGAPRISLLGRVNCHLCGPAREVLAQVRELTGHGWAEVDVDTDPELRSEFGDLVPVVLVDGELVASRAIEQEAVIAALNSSS